MIAVKPFKSEKDVISIRDAMPLKHKIWFILAVRTGFRISDILRLTVEDVSMYPITIKERKTGKMRSVTPVLTTFEEWLLSEWIAQAGLLPSDYLIPSRPTQRKKHLSRIQAYRVLKRAIAECNHITPSDMPISLHSARKTFAVDLYHREGFEAVQANLGHRDAATTMRYLAADGKHMSFFVKDLNEVLEKDSHFQPPFTPPLSGGVLASEVKPLKDSWLTKARKRLIAWFFRLTVFIERLFR